MPRTGRWALPLLVSACLAASCAFARNPTCARGCIAIEHARVYSSPDSEPLLAATVLIRGDRILAVGVAKDFKISPEARVIDATGMTLTAGFQNSHVHFTAPQWQHSNTLPVDQLEQQLQEMLTRYGFMSVLDLASDLGNTVALRRRIESGEIAGPHILTVGWALYPPDGVPFYVKLDSSAAEVARLKTPRTPAEAVRDVEADLRGGADAIKLFTGSIASRTEIKPMPRDVAIAAAAAAHRHGKLVVSHATNVEGLAIALDAKVDILAHAIEVTDGLTQDYIARMLSAHMALIPTLNLFKDHKNLETILEMVSNCAKGGGDILFGTDVGNLPGYDPIDEYRLMARAGLTYRQILASLTTTPARRFGETKAGKVAPGMRADVVLLGGDPRADVSAFAAVRYTIRRGKVIFESAPVR